MCALKAPNIHLGVLSEAAIVRIEEIVSAEAVRRVHYAESQLDTTIMCKYNGRGGGCRGHPFIAWHESRVPETQATYHVTSISFRCRLPPIIRFCHAAHLWAPDSLTPKPRSLPYTREHLNNSPTSSRIHDSFAGAAELARCTGFSEASGLAPSTRMCWP